MSNHVHRSRGYRQTGTQNSSRLQSYRGLWYIFLSVIHLLTGREFKSSTALFKVVTYLTIQHKLSGAFQNDRGQQMFCQTEPLPYIKYSIFIFTPQAAKL